MLCHQNGPTLKTLHLHHFHGNVKKFLKNCVHLKDLRIEGSCHLNKKHIMFLMKNVPSTIEKLSLSGIDHIDDVDVEFLVQRCTNLKMLDLSFTRVSEESLTYISVNCNLLEELHMKSSYTRMNDSAFQQLSAFQLLIPLSRLKLFTCRYNMEDIDLLKIQLPHLKDIQIVPFIILQCKF